MDPDEMFEVALVLQGEAGDLREHLDKAQPRTTKEQWEALDALISASNHLLIASQKLGADDA
jgi:hypothetical protein